MCKFLLYVNFIRQKFFFLKILNLMENNKKISYIFYIDVIRVKRKADGITEVWNGDGEYSPPR